MKKYNILVTGVGAIIGYGIVRSLRQCRYNVNIIGMDIYPDAVGQRWCDGFIQSLWAADAKYCDFLSDVMDKYKIDFVFFGLEQEIHRICDDWVVFRGNLNKLIINDRALIALSRDKWSLYEYLMLNKVKAIRSMTEGDYDAAVASLGVPFLVKPRRSTAAKGISIINSPQDFYYWQKKLDKEFMVQEIVGDDEHEYTVGIFGLGDGSLTQSIAFSRKLSREGSTVKARTVNLPELDEEVKRLTAIFKPLGPTNFQFRWHKGDYLLLEVNPRFSSSLSLRTAFGFNETEMCLRFFGENVRPDAVVLEQGTAVRYIEDIVNIT